MRSRQPQSSALRRAKLLRGKHSLVCFNDVAGSNVDAAHASRVAPSENPDVPLTIAMKKAVVK